MQPQRGSELHGSAWQIAEMAGEPDAEPILRRWSEQNKRVIWEDRDVPFRTHPPYRDPHTRPNVLLFDEEYGDRLLWVRDFIHRQPDVVLVVGCSGA